MILHVPFCSLCTMAMLYYLLTTDKYYNKYRMTLPTSEPFDAHIRVFIILESSQRENKNRESRAKKKTHSAHSVFYKDSLRKVKKAHRTKFSNRMHRNSNLNRYAFVMAPWYFIKSRG